MTDLIVSVVVIGRNEGARLSHCLASIKGRFERVVYVDSASTDDSVDVATQAGVTVISLDTSRPFSAARGRNEGFEALAGDNPPDLVQFIDGDCILEPDWLAQGVAAMQRDKEIGIVTGWRAEIHRDRSVYNALCDFEWHRPAGDIAACGGDMLVRAEVFRALDGFNETVIAAEDDEFCTRVRKLGLRITRLPVAMTKHDANMLDFTSWWRRAMRSGHGFAQVGHLHKGYFASEKRRVVVFGAVLPVLAILGLGLSLWLFVGVLGIYLLSYIRTCRGLLRAGLARREALHHALFLSVSKFPNLIGMVTYYGRLIFGRKIQIIEYK